MEKISVAKYLISLIPGTGVDTVGVLQGGAIAKLIDEVGEHPDLSYVSPNHEQALSMMVEAYARVKGFGVGMVTSGPGAQNLVTGIASAYYDSIPCLFITGQVGMFHNKANRRVRQRGFQETDVVSLMKSITKYSVLLDKPEDARYIFEKAVHLAKSGRPGPVLIDVPFNVQRALVDPSELRAYNPEPVETSSPAEIDHGITEILHDLQTKEKPIILLGGGVELSKTAGAVRKLVKHAHVPAVVTWCALDVFEANDPLYGGNVGRAGNKSANRAIREADFVLALGTRFATKAIISEKNFATKAKITTIDADRGELEDGLITSHVKIQSTLEKFMPPLLAAAEKVKFTPKQAWLEEFAALKADYFREDNTPAGSAYVSPYEFTARLSKAMDPNTIIVGDTGTNLCWVAQAYEAKIGQRFFSSWGNSPMGYALPASIGAQIAAKDKTVVCITGDGGMQMNIQELQTIALHKFPVKVFVFNNDCYMNVKAPSIDEFEGRYHALGRGMGYAAPDFVKIANAYGIEAFSIKKGDDLDKKIQQALSTKGPVVVDLKLDPDQRAVEDNALVSLPAFAAQPKSGAPATPETKK